MDPRLSRTNYHEQSLYFSRESYLLKTRLTRKLMLVGQISGNIRVRLLSSTEIEHSIATLNRCPNFIQQTAIVFTSQYELVEVS